MFLPRKIATREVEYAKIQAKKLAEHSTFVANFKLNLLQLQSQTSTNPIEQSFIVMAKNMTVYTDTDEKYVVYLLNADKQMLLGYNWQTDELRYSSNAMWFKNKHHMDETTMADFLITMMQQHFHL